MTCVVVSQQPDHQGVDHDLYESTFTALIALITSETGRNTRSLRLKLSAILSSSVGLCVYQAGNVSNLLKSDMIKLTCIVEQLATAVVVDHFWHEEID